MAEKKKRKEERRNRRGRRGRRRRKEIWKDKSKYLKIAITL